MKPLDEAYENYELVRAADMLYSAHYHLQEKAAQTLIEAGEGSIPILKKILTGEEAERLMHRYDEMYGIPRVSLYGDWVKRKAAEILAKIGEPSLPVLVVLLEHKEEKTRDAAIHALRSEKLAEEAVELVLPLLKHKKSEVRDAAAKVLALYDNQQIIDGFREMLRIEIETQRKKTKRKKKYSIGILIIWLIAAVVMVKANVKNWGGLLNVMMQLSNFIIGGRFAVSYASGAAKDALKTAQGKFDARMLGTLVMCLQGADSDTHEIVTQELKRILVEVKMDDKQYLNEEEMKILLKQLDGKDENFTIAILKGLEQIGDEWALPYVERLAQKTNPKRRRTVQEILLTPIGGKRSKPEDFVTVSEAAKACLPYLHQRIEEATASSTLLRASSQKEMSKADELLRPALGCQEKHEAELLRPTIS